MKEMNMEAGDRLLKEEMEKSRRLNLKEKLKKESKLVRENSMSVLKEFEQIDHEPPH